jgi:hypothetical protein
MSWWLSLSFRKTPVFHGNKQGFRQSRRYKQQETRTFPTNFCVHRTFLLTSVPFNGFFPVKSADRRFCKVFPALYSTYTLLAILECSVKQFYNLFVWRQIPTEKIGKNAVCKNLILNTVTCAVFSTTFLKNYGIILTDDEFRRRRLERTFSVTV